MSARQTLRWLRVNLFATPFHSAVTLILLPACLWLLWHLTAWATTRAQWHVVTDSLRVLMIGTFPEGLTDRAWVAAGALALATGLTLAALARRQTPLRHGGRGLAALWLVALVLVGAMLEPASTQHWGGLLMSVLMTLAAAVLSLPLGVALAFGRRSRFAGVRVVCTGYIELVRSLPLILVVYWVWLVTPMLVQSAPPDLLRGLLAFSLFYAAHVAEYVRSGLQAVPRGQVEAAQSLGLSRLAVQRDVVLPQALRVVTPALAGNVLDIFNNVPLLFIIGLTDFFRAGQMVLINPESGGRSYEIYLFMFAVYLLVASLITWGARRVEARMAVAHH